MTLLGFNNDFRILGSISFFSENCLSRFYRQGLWKKGVSKYVRAFAYINGIYGANSEYSTHATGFISAK